jgi:hypothetical protein
MFALEGGSFGLQIGGEATDSCAVGTKTLPMGNHRPGLTDNVVVKFREKPIQLCPITGLLLLPLLLVAGPISVPYTTTRSCKGALSS